MVDDSNSYRSGYYGFKASWQYPLGSWGWRGASQRESDNAQRARLNKESSGGAFWGAAIEAGIITSFVASAARFGIGDFGYLVATYLVVLVAYMVLQLIPMVRWAFLTFWSAVIFNSGVWHSTDTGSVAVALFMIAVIVLERFLIYANPAAAGRFVATSMVCVVIGAAFGALKQMNISDIGVAFGGCSALDKEYTVVVFQDGTQDISRNQSFDIRKGQYYKIKADCGRKVMLSNGGLTDKYNLAWVDSDHPDIGLHSDQEVALQKAAVDECPQVVSSIGRPSCNSVYARAQLCRFAATKYDVVPRFSNFRMTNPNNRLGQIECQVDTVISTAPNFRAMAYSMGIYNGKQVIYIIGFR